MAGVVFNDLLVFSTLCDGDCAEDALNRCQAEQTLVAANRELIARFEKKIQATLARVWGAETPVLGERGL